MIWQGRNPAQLEQAAQCLARGQLLGFPTETVYGLGADATQDEAVRGIFAAKGRPLDHPLIVHIAQAEDASEFADPIPDFARVLMAAHWPGPLTLILPRRAHVAEVCAASQPSIGLRCPSHPVALSLLRAARRLGVKGIAGPSANRFGRVSPTRASHVVEEFGAQLPVLDGGPCSVGIESSIVDCTRGQPILLRPGMLDADTLSHTLGLVVLKPEQAGPAGLATAPKASGTLASHYAPDARVRLLDVAAMELRASGLSPEALSGIAVWSPQSPQFKAGHWRAMPLQSSDCAQQLFDVLRDFEHARATEIWVCPPPPGTAWDGVRDRLTRASH